MRLNRALVIALASVAIGLGPGAFTHARAAGTATSPDRGSGPVMNGLAVWLEANQGLSSDGSTWTDQSGNGHNAAALPGQAPSVVQNGLHGLPVASFSGGQAMSIAGAVLSDPQNYTVVALVTDTGFPASGFREIMSNWDPGNQESSVFLGTVTGKIGKKTTDRIRFTDYIGGDQQGQSGQGKFRKPAAPFILSGLSSSTDASIYLSTKLQYDLGAPIPSRNLSYPWFLGDQGSGQMEYWNGYVAEVLVYNRTLAPSELKTDVSYLHKKWI